MLDCRQAPARVLGPIKNAIVEGATGDQRPMFRATAILWMGALAVTACTRNSGQSPGVTGQVAARIGDQVVTTLEIENELRLANVSVERRTDPVVIKQLLEQLVLRKYLVQQALDAKLDQEPNVLLDIMRAREQVLANAFIARDGANRSIGKSDVDKYIAENPAKFAQRQLLTVEQIRFALGPGTQAVTEANKEMKTLDEVDRKLTNAGIAHTRSVNSLSQSDIPPELAKVLESRKPDEVFYGRAGRFGLYFKVKDEETHPLGGNAAENSALEALRTQALKTKIEAAADAAHKLAQYEGDYAKIMSSTPTPAPVSIDAPASKAAEAETH